MLNELLEKLERLERRKINLEATLARADYFEERMTREFQLLEAFIRVKGLEKEFERWIKDV